jgi:hypothetical protein
MMGMANARNKNMDRSIYRWKAQRERVILPSILEILLLGEER